MNKECYKNTIKRSYHKSVQIYWSTISAFRNVDRCVPDTDYSDIKRGFRAQRDHQQQTLLRMVEMRVSKH